MTSDERAQAAALCAVARRLSELGMTPARDGNLSLRLDDDRLLVTRSGVRKRELVPDDLVPVSLVDGRPLTPGARPTTELGLHRIVYRLRPGVRAVLHAHPPYAVALACAGQDLVTPLMPEAVVNLGPVPLTPYARPGTPEMEAAVEDAARTALAFLLSNHGAVTTGRSLDEALDRMEILEHTAHVTWAVQALGGGNALSPGAVAALRPQDRS